jgi:4-alpha-glucanotransferase
LSGRFQLDRRASGVLLHPTSLPGPHGCGDLGDHARRFADFLDDAGQHAWQMLPIGPADRHGCPYSAYSTFAGDPILISLHRLYEDGLLTRADVAPLKTADPTKVDYRATRKFRDARLRRAFDRFMAKPARSRGALDRFREKHKGWLDDWTLFGALRHAHRGKHWWKWAPGQRQRRKRDLDRARAEWSDEIAFSAFVQFQFDRQWSALKRYCTDKGVGLIGDIPIFVAHDSCDVWARPELFRLKPNGMPAVVSGAAPDAFSRTGQLWNHPLYDWRRHKAEGFDWWVSRFRHSFTQFDAVRIDHFLGFSRYWEVPAGHRTALRGRWRKGPGADLFTALERRLGNVPIIAEDLGLLTPQAQALRDRFAFPGMRVLQEAFGKDDSYHAPHNYPTRCVVYTGTHDNDTARGWFAKADKKARNGQPSERQRALLYTDGSPRTIHWDLIRLALSSVADTTIFPVQDLLGLGNEARMNVPGTIRGNWRWRVKPGQLTAALARRLGAQTRLFGRD